jgi:hypothetical protein
MKKILLLSAVACSILLYACKKDDKTTTPVTEVPNPMDPVTLSSNIKIGYATNVKGDIPAASTSSDAPLLSTDGYDNRTYTAISGRYVVIYPESSQGYIQGYYVKINGADSYFKVDYKAGYDLRKKAAGARKATKGHNTLRDGDNADSSIVIKLPEGLTGDTFTIKYAAYDSLNRVSNAITAIISLVHPDSSANSLLIGNWRYNRYKANDNDWYSPYTYGQDTSKASYSCVDGVLTYGCDGDVNCLGEIITEIRGDSANNIIFGANSQYKELYRYIHTSLNQELSTCSQLKYDDNGESNIRLGGYAYNATTKMLTIIHDGAGTHDNYATNIYTQQVKVSEISSTKLVLVYSYNNGNDNLYFYYNEFLKQ